MEVSNLSAIDTFIGNNANYAAEFSKGDLPLPPAKKIAIVACMDARLDMGALLGLEEGDAHVIRNAGGVVTDDAIRSLTISQRLMGTREIMLVHHTDCGMLTGSRGRCAGLDRKNQGEPVRAAQGRNTRFRVRGRDRASPRGGVATAESSRSRRRATARVAGGADRRSPRRCASAVDRSAKPEPTAESGPLGGRRDESLPVQVKKRSD